MAKKLTSRSVEQAKPDPAKRREVPDALLSGLYLVIQPSGAKSWAVRYRYSRAPRKLTLGSYPVLGLSQARARAREALQAVGEGRDPVAEKKVIRRHVVDRDLLTRVVDEYQRRYVIPNNRASWAAEVDRLLKKEVLPHWRDRSVAEISRRDVIELLDGIVDRGGGITANRVLAVIRRMFNWAIERGILEVTPCAKVKPPLAERSRDRILSDNEINLFWRACQEIGFPFGPVAKLLLLTGQRLREVGAMTSDELDFERRQWTISRERAKNDEAHIVPLSDAALQVVENLPLIPSPKRYLFTTTGVSPVSGWSGAKKKIDRLMQDFGRKEVPDQGEDPSEAGNANWTFHDLRRTAASGMARLGIALPTIEKILNHRSGSFAGIVGVYQRHDFADEKRRALEGWAGFLLKLIEERRSAIKFVTLRAPQQ